MTLHAQAFRLVLSPAQSVDQEDWVRVHAQASTGTFAGEFEAYLQLEDLRRFERELRAMHAKVGSEQEAVLSCFEPGIYVRLVSKQLGGVRGTFRLNPEQGETASELSGSFQADQSSLPEWAGGIQDLIAALQPQNDA